MIKVLLAVPSLDDLGVQHDIRTLMQFWDKGNYDIKMLLHSRTGNFASQFPKSMKSIQVDDFCFKTPKIRVLSRFLGYIKAIAKEKPDVIISFVPYSNYGCIFAKIFGKHKFGLAISEHAHVTAAMADHENMANIFMKIYRKTFPYIYNSKTVNRIKCIAEESMNDLIANHSIQPNKTTLIHNPVPITEIRSLSKQNIEHPWFSKENKDPIIINVARLSYQKQQDKLLRAFAKVKSSLNCKLILIGSGKQDVLQSIAKDLGIINHVYFVGFESNPWKWMAKSDLFVLSSIWEGLPCVLTEAMALGLPIVSTKCPSGPKEMLMNGEAGYLCEENSVDDLARKILYALTNKDETIKKTRIATQNIHRFEPISVVKKYENLTSNLANIYIN